MIKLLNLITLRFPCGRDPAKPVLWRPLRPRMNETSPKLLATAHERCEEQRDRLSFRHRVKTIII